MYVIDKINHEDLNSLAGLYYELSGRETDINKMKEIFSSMESNPDYIILGVKEKDNLVGSLMGVVCKDLLGDCKPFIVIENVIVSSKYRGKGIGKKLIVNIEEVARRRGCSYIMFVSAKERSKAHKFYEKIGYKLDMVQGFKKYL